jgi:ferrochelatase
MNNNPRGVLLVEVGTPSELTQNSVQHYLNEFLGDPYVIRGPQWIREILFKRIIIPLRAAKSLEKYRRIWTESGSPLRVEAEVVTAHLENILNADQTSSWMVRFAFHYGGPSIESALEDLKVAGVRDLVILPLYPQWALSTRGSLEDRLRVLKVYSGRDQGYGFERVLLAPVFYNSEGFQNAQAALLKKYLPTEVRDDVAVVFSFHGLPQTHIRAVVPSCKTCLKREGECRPNPQTKPYCYRYQCLETARQIASRAGLYRWDVAFQSRLGPTKWLGPALLENTAHLLEQGVTTMVVQCPSFVIDCLETLEEVGLELKHYFLKNGGKNFILVPALNHSELWLEALKDMIIEHSGVANEINPSSASPKTP